MRGEGTPTPPVTPPVIATADLDEDGDEDVVAIDDQGRVSFVLSATVDADENRVLVQDLASPTLDPATATFEYAVLPIASAAQVEWELWYLPDGASAVNPTPVTGTAPAGEPLLLSVELPSSSPHATIQLLFRPLAAVQPTTTYHWIADPITYQQELLQKSAAVYPWRTQAMISVDDGGGTTRRPRIGPVTAEEQ